MGRHVGQHADKASIVHALDAAPVMFGVQLVGLDLDAGDTAWHPDSTRATARMIAGPSLVIYRRYGDGEIRATVTDRDVDAAS